MNSLTNSYILYASAPSALLKKKKTATVELLRKRAHSFLLNGIGNPPSKAYFRAILGSSPGMIAVDPAMFAPPLAAPRAYLIVSYRI